jgi:hypothetical protein
MIGFQLAPSQRAPCPRPARPEARHFATVKAAEWIRLTTNGG